jgi:hypothetical protein
MNLDSLCLTLYSRVMRHFKDNGGMGATMDCLLTVWWKERDTGGDDQDLGS